ncbi:DUF4747 family protein [Sagittula sp. NFXS13]|uniref:DUF4747 family protein n=1 Tax=Sagittula sp. NFXS13 TaxID=2819095 RepID=UPI0032DF7CC5
MRKRIATFTAINVAANPHPEGTYRRLLKDAARLDGANYGRNWYAKLTPPSKSKDGFFHGRIGVWHHLEGKAIKQKSLEQQDVQDILVEGADGFGFPSKVFSWTFREADHVLFSELKNNDGDSITATAIGNAFREILTKVAVDRDIDISVTILPEKGTVQKIFKMQEIKTLEVSFSLPNGDDLSGEKKNIIDKLRERNIKKQQAKYTKSSDAKTITLDDDLRAEIELASENGKARAVGLNRRGEKDDIDTSMRPKIIKREIEAAESNTILLRSVAAEVD